MKKFRELLEKDLSDNELDKLTKIAVEKMKKIQIANIKGKKYPKSNLNKLLNKKLNDGELNYLANGISGQLSYVKFDFKK